MMVLYFISKAVSSLKGKLVSRKRIPLLKYKHAAAVSATTSPDVLKNGYLVNTTVSANAIVSAKHTACVLGLSCHNKELFRRRGTRHTCAFVVSCFHLTRMCEPVLPRKMSSEAVVRASLSLHLASPRLS